MRTIKHLLMLLATVLVSATVATTMTGCSFIDFQTPSDTEQGEDTGNENTGSTIPEEPLTSGPATLSLTRATATTARFEGSITNPEVDLDFVKIILRYAEPEAFSAMDETLPNVVVTKQHLDSENKFSFCIDDLKHNQSYKFCAIVQYKNDVFYSEVEEFKTAGVKVNLAVVEDSVTDSSVELDGNVEGLSKEDADKLEVGLLYSEDGTLVESGEGVKVVLENIEDDGVVSVALTDLYDAPKYYYRTYVKQGENCDLGKVGSFELKVENVRLVKRITRTEKVLDNEFSAIYEFAYDNNRIVENKVSEIEDDYTAGYRYTYDYSTKGKVAVEEYLFEDGEEYQHQTFEVNLDKRGNALNFDYVWEDENWDGSVETYNYTVDLNYTSEGYLSGWSETEDGTLAYAVTLDYVDGGLNKFEIDRKDVDEDYDSIIMTDGFSSTRELKDTSYDLNRALMPFLSPEIELTTFGAVKMGTYGRYYLDRMYVENLWMLYDESYPIVYDTTTDAKYSEEVTYNTYEVENLEEDFDALPITTVNCDAEGYPTEFIVDIRAREVEVTVTYGVGEVAWVDEYDGTTYYYITEIDRKSSEGAVTSVGSASIAVEYVD